jgi:hypothetical protein
MPTKEEIRKFLEVVEALNRFEMDHRARCGWGAWTEGEQILPFPEAVKVTAWLRTIADRVDSGSTECFERTGL